MNQELNPIVALLIIIVFVVLLGAKFWAHDQATDTFAYSYMQSHPDGTVYIQLQNQLYGIDQQGALKQQINLANYGVDPETPTDFAFFSNGDLLLRKNTSPRSLLDNHQRFLRHTNTTSEYADDDVNALFRCVITTEQCQPFSDPALNLNYAFAVDIDWQSNRVFISDAARHKVYLFSEAGKEMDRLESRLKFPNQITFQKGELFIANTNRHNITFIAVDENGFNGDIQIMSVLTGQLDQEGQVWPASFLLTDDLTWTINSKNNMVDGGIYLFDDLSGFVKKLDLPDNADPFEIIQLGEHVLVNDYSQGLIYQYDLSGKRLDDFSVPLPMQTVLDDLSQRREYFNTLEQVFDALFKVLVSLGFGVAIWQYYFNKNRVSLIQSAQIQELASNASDIYWLRVDQKYSKKTKLTVAILLPVFLVFMLYLINQTGAEINLAGLRIMLFISILFGLFSAYLILRSVKARVGVIDHMLILVSGSGKHVAATPEQIYYSDNSIVIGDVFISIGNEPTLFLTEDLVEYVYPLLNSANYISNSQMQLLHIKANKLIFTTLMLMILSLLFYLF